MKAKKQWRFLCLFGEEDAKEALPATALQAAPSGEIKDSTPVAGEQTDPEEREKAFRTLMEGEYKDLFTAYFQETFNRRFREQKEIGEELKKSRALVQAAAKHFGVEEDGLLAAIRAEDGKKNAPTASAASDENKDGAEKRLTERDLQDAVERTRAETEQRLLSAIRTRGLRPAEAALHGAGGNALSGEGGRMSRAQRAELARRAAEGEKISL